MSWTATGSGSNPAWAWAFASPPREVAFCAHAILAADTMVVPDALQDSRFADNPLITGEPRVRFYAGQPLSAPDGSRVGTLCIIDHRPRQLAGPDLQALRDLGAIVEKELSTRATMTDFPGRIAESIQVGNPAFPSCSTGCIAQSRGTAVALSDDEILAAQFLNGSVG